MGNYTREEILQMVEEEDVEFIRLQFTDMYGAIKNIAVTTRELPRALDNQCIVNGEQIAGMNGENGTDLYLRPVLGTFSILPWRPQQGKVARMICDLYCPDGKPYKNSPRYILENTATKAEAEGYTCFIDPECEFFLFHTDDDGKPTTVTHEKAGYLDISPLDLGENARRDMVLTLEDMGMEVESSHHEAAPAQHEIDFHYGEIRKIADCIMTFKMAVRTVAKRHGLHATFMPKPKSDVNGSGMHIQFSLLKNGRNIFENISETVDMIFSNYLSRPGVLQPILTQYCDGRRVSCPNWMSQWGSKDLGEQGYSPIEILRYYYGDDIYINSAEQISGIPSSWPGYDLTIGSSGQKVQQMQEQLNRISDNYPAIPKIAADGIYGNQTAEAVRTFQKIFNLPQTGVTDYATWYKISQIYVGVSRIAELN